MQYVGKGIRALGRAAVAAGMALALAAPAYAQNLNLREGLYGDENKHGEDWETCTLTRHENDPRNEWRNCDSKENGVSVHRMVRNGQLRSVSYHFPDGTMKVFDVVSPEVYKSFSDGKGVKLDLSGYIIEGTSRYTAELKTATEIAERRKRDDEFWEKMRKQMEAERPIR